MRGGVATVLMIAQSACVTPQVHVTSIGPLMVVPDDEVTIFTPVALADGSVIEPTPIQGGLVVRMINGRAVPFEAREAALEAMEAHCRDQEVPGVPLYFGWRDVGGAQSWTAAGCDPVVEDIARRTGAE